MNGSPVDVDRSNWRQLLARWWSEFSLQTKLLAVATLVVSLLMTGITFLALNGIQRDARFSDTRYGRDLGLLLSANVTPLVAEGKDRELAEVADRFWHSSSSLRYIFFADPLGLIYLGIPIGANSGSSELLLSRRPAHPEESGHRPPGVQPLRPTPGLAAALDDAISLLPLHRRCCRLKKRCHSISSGPCQGTLPQVWR